MSGLPGGAPQRPRGARGPSAALRLAAPTPACLQRRQCTHACPQKIDVPEQMQKLAALMAGQKSWEEVCAERAATAAAARG